MPKPLSQGALDKLLHMSAHNANFDLLVDELIDAGADINQEGSLYWQDGETRRAPLVVQAARSFVRTGNTMVLDLLTKGPEINSQDFRLNPLSVVFLYFSDPHDLSEKNYCEARLEQLYNALVNHGYSLQGLVDGGVNILAEIVHFHCNAWANGCMTKEGIVRMQFRLLVNCVAFEDLDAMVHAEAEVKMRDGVAANANKTLRMSPVDRVVRELANDDINFVTEGLIHLAAGLVRCGGDPERRMAATVHGEKPLSHYIGAIRSRRSNPKAINDYDVAVAEVLSIRASRQMTAQPTSRSARRI